jgi:predicted GIY-YIG superfamily endonuclease
MGFWVYLLHCADHSYYVGHTDDVERRVAEHQRGEIAGHTASRRPVRLLRAESFPFRGEALRAERQLKGWSRKKKEVWSEGNWAEVARLGRRRTGFWPPRPSRCDALRDAANRGRLLRANGAEFRLHSQRVLRCAAGKLEQARRSGEGRVGR